jgi:hypothetical protein
VSFCVPKPCDCLLPPQDLILPSMPWRRRAEKSEALVQAAPAMPGDLRPAKVLAPPVAQSGSAAKLTLSANWRGGVRNQIARLEQDLADAAFTGLPRDP